MLFLFRLLSPIPPSPNRRTRPGEGEVQGNRRRPGHRLRRAHPQGIGHFSPTPRISIVLTISTTILGAVELSNAFDRELNKNTNTNGGCNDNNNNKNREIAAQSGRSKISRSGGNRLSVPSLHHDVVSRRGDLSVTFVFLLR